MQPVVASLIEQQYFEFGTLINVTMISEDRALALSLFQQIEDNLAQWRGYWHGWEDSDLTRFNQQIAQQGEARVPPSLQELLTLSQRYYWRATACSIQPWDRLIGAPGFHGKPGGHAELVTTIRADILTHG